MRFPRYVLPLLVGLCCGLSATAAQAAPCAGQSGPSVGEASFLDPPNDEYCTFIDVTICNGPTLKAHWELFWSSACTIPTQVYLRNADFVSSGCYTPGAIVGTPIPFDLVGADAATVDHVSPPLEIPSPSTGKFFICFKVLTNGTCPDGTPMANPHLRLDATNDACQSYNITQGGTTDLTILAGNPVMWVESVPCTDGQLGPSAGEASFLDPPNDEYATYVNLTGCSTLDDLRVHWELFWSSACTIPAQVQFRSAIESGPGCYTPGPLLGAPVPYDLVGANGAIVDHVSPPIPYPVPGHYFVCITVLTNGTCPDGTPMGNPHLRLDGTPDACQSYNPNAAGDLIATAGMSGNPVMWLEPAPAQPPVNRPPDCSAAHASPDRIKGNNHKFRSIRILGVTDPDGDQVRITITGVTQDEPVSGRKGAGRTCPDAKFSGNQVSVRAEHDGERPRDGRVYVIRFIATDEEGATCEGSVKVCVTNGKWFSKKDDALSGEVDEQLAGGGHGPGNRPDCVDSGQNYNSLGPCDQRDHKHHLLAEDALDLAVDEVTSSRAQISFSVPAEGPVEVAVFDLLGRRLATLERASMTSGIHETSWKMDGVQKGLYFVRITRGEEVVTRQVIKLQ